MLFFSLIISCLFLVLFSYGSSLNLHGNPIINITCTAFPVQLHTLLPKWYCKHKIFIRQKTSTLKFKDSMERRVCSKNGI